MEKGLRMKVILLVSVFIFTGCQSSKKIIEFYKSYDKETRSSRVITLNNDYTFDYKHEVGLISSHSKGVWSLQNDSLLVKSNETYKNGFIEVKLDDNTDTKDSIVITVLSKEYQIPIASAIVIIDSLDIYLVTDEMGRVVVASNLFSNFTLSFLGNNYTFTSKDKINTDVNVFLVEENLSKTYFDDEKWIKKGNKITTSDGTVFKLKKCIKKKNIPSQKPTD